MIHSVQLRFKPLDCKCSVGNWSCEQLLWQLTGRTVASTSCYPSRGRYQNVHGHTCSVHRTSSDGLWFHNFSQMLTQELVWFNSTIDVSYKDQLLRKTCFAPHVFLSGVKPLVRERTKAFWHTHVTDDPNPTYHRCWLVGGLKTHVQYNLLHIISESCILMYSYHIMMVHQFFLNIQPSYLPLGTHSSSHSLDNFHLTIPVRTSWLKME